MTGAGPFTGRFGQVWHGPRDARMPDGSAAKSLGFCLATVEKHIDGRDDIARQIAAALNLTENLREIERTVMDAQRLIDDLCRHIGQMSIPDYSLLVSVPADLAELRTWLTIARRETALIDAA